MFVKRCLAQNKNDRMRLMMVSAFPPNPQGESNYCGFYFDALQQRRPEWDYRIVSQQQEGSPASTTLPSGTTVVRPLSPKTWKRHLSGWKILLEVMRFRPDIIHFQGLVLPDYGGMFGEAMIPFMLLYRLLGAKLVVTLHSTWMRRDLQELCDAKKLSGIASQTFKAYFDLVLQLVLKATNLMAVLVAGENSPAIDDWMTDFGIKSREKLVEEVHPCRPVANAEENGIKAKEELGISGKRLLVACGFVREDKGFHLLLEILPGLQKKYPDLVVCIAGRPQGASGQAYAERLRAMRDELPDPERCILYARYLPDAELFQYLDAAEVLVVPYTRALGASGPTHHCLSRSKAILLSDIGQNRGLKGICEMFSAGNRESLNDKIVMLLNNESRLHELRNSAGAYARAHTYDSLAQFHLKNFESLLDLHHTAEQELAL